VVSRAICLNYLGLLPVIGQHRGVLIRHLLDDSIGRGRSPQNVALCPKSSLGIVGNTFADGVQSLVNFTSHSTKRVGVVQ
jgi:hypothetical protein